MRRKTVAEIVVEEMASVPHAYFSRVPYGPRTIQPSGISIPSRHRGCD